MRSLQSLGRGCSACHLAGLLHHRRVQAPFCRSYRTSPVRAGVDERHIVGEVSDVPMRQLRRPVHIADVAASKTSELLFDHRISGHETPLKARSRAISATRSSITGTQPTSSGARDLRQKRRAPRALNVIQPVPWRPKCCAGGCRGPKGMEKLVGLQTKKCVPCKGGDGLAAMDEADANKIRNQV